MNIHIALYKWKDNTSDKDIIQTLLNIEALASKIPGIIDIVTGRNTSKHSEGYSHVILVRGENRAAIDAYRRHPEHFKIAQKIEAMEDNSIGVDFVS